MNHQSLTPLRVGLELFFLISNRSIKRVLLIDVLIFIKT